MNTIKLIIWAFLALIAGWAGIITMIATTDHEIGYFALFGAICYGSAKGAHKLYDIWAIGSIVDNIKILEDVHNNAK